MNFFILSKPSEQNFNHILGILTNDSEIIKLLDILLAYELGDK